MARKIKPIKRKKNEIQDTIEAILFAFVVAFLIKNYIFQNFKIPSSSMESTMLIGDFLYGDRTRYYFTDPQQGDIVIFQHPGDPDEPGLPTLENPHPQYTRDDYMLLIKPIYINKKNFKPVWHQKKNIVKRVIGMPGDTIQVVNKHVLINGKEFRTGTEQYIDSRVIPRNNGNIMWNDTFMGSRDNIGPVVVPPDSYFVMGDNRDVSADSRYWGFLPRKAITGAPAFVFFSHGAPPARTYRDAYYRSQGINRQPARIRWNRIFKVFRNPLKHK
ncbi:MAG: signal peptidase I [Candidatus Cloacimonetes bacterium]|nr:signal peptidase I [Candidatus Cloacimonadota bacterium]